MGPAAFIKKARHFRKLFGAGTRQIGPLVAAARVGVQKTYPLLSGTHELAKYAGRELEKLGVRITAPVETSMVFMDPTPIDVSVAELVTRAAALAEPIKLGGGRLVCHYQIERRAVDDLLALVRTLKEEKTRGTTATATASATATGGAGGLYSSNANPRGVVFKSIAASSGSYNDIMKHSVSLTLPFPTRETALTLQNAISVDRELRPKDTRKEFAIRPTPSGETVELAVKIFATTVRHLRLSVNAFLEDAALVTRTMAEFDPLQRQLDEAKKIQLDMELEQGSVGIAG